MEKLIRDLIKQLEEEKEPTYGSEWQSGYNNGLARASELLCELHRTVLGNETRQSHRCEYCGMLNKKIIDGAGHLIDNKPLMPFVGINYCFTTENGICSTGLEAKFCPICGKKLNI